MAAGNDMERTNQANKSKKTKKTKFKVLRNIIIVELIILLFLFGAYKAMDIFEDGGNKTSGQKNEQEKDKKDKKDKGVDENPYLAEIDRLKLELENAEAVIVNLEEENSELKQQLSVVEKERNELKAVNEENSTRTEQLQQLAEYYSNIRVKKAAAIMAELDDDTIIGILSNMGDETAAGIIGELEPQRAAVLTKKMLSAKGGE